MPKPLLAMLMSTMLFGTSLVSGQNYPNKSIRIVTGPPAGGNDVATRLIAQGLTGPLGQPVIVENRSGGVIPGEIVSRAQPDGYTLLVFNSPLWVAPLLQSNVPYDPVKDFSPVSLTTSSPNILVVHPSVAVNSVRELIALAKAKPGYLNYATGPTGASNHLAAELFKYMAAVNMVRIAYQGGGPALNGLISAQVHLLFASAGSVIPHVKSGRLRALAVTSREPSALAPGLPTMAASGLPGYEAESPTGMFAPAKTPAAIINRLNQEIVRFLNAPDTKARLLSTGAEAVASSPEEFGAAIKSEIAILSKVIKDAGIRAE